MGQHGRVAMATNLPHTASTDHSSPGSRLQARKGQASSCRSQPSGCPSQAPSGCPAGAEALEAATLTWFPESVEGQASPGSGLQARKGQAKHREAKQIKAKHREAKQGKATRSKA